MNKIKEIEKLDISPGDTLVITVPEKTAEIAVERIHDGILEHLPDNIRLLVKTNSIKLKVIPNG